MQMRRWMLVLSLAWGGTALAQTPAGLPRVVDALKAAPGVLGVETGSMASGRQAIFAWFEGKQALVDWYQSDAHLRAMKAVFPEVAPQGEPLRELADHSGPILALVSVKFSASAIASIGIELYGPLPGGGALGGRFAPASVKVRGLREIAPR